MDEVSRRDIPSFIEPRPPLINNPFMRPRPQKGTNLLELFEEDSEIEEPDLVQVYLRMKPHDGPNNLYEVRSDKCLVTSLDTTTAGHGRRTQHNVSRMYTFSRIFDGESTQKEIFDQVVKENLRKLVEGHSFTLLTYGASGSGKTYTLMGTVNSPGLVPRSLEYVFKLVDAAQTPLYKPSDSGADQLGKNQQEFELQWVKRLRQVSAPARDKYRRMSAQLRSDITVNNFDLTNRSKYYVWVSFVEIYNEAIFDLLAPPDKRVKLRMREDSNGQVYVKGATQAFVRTGVEAYDVMVAGKHNLVVAATGVHAHSSRSHCIFTITMLTETETVKRDLDGELRTEIRTSCVRLCDLAGCERARATRNTGTRMQESRSINTSLHVLERCLHMLRSNQRARHDALVPYRESKLTRLLGSGLSGCRGEAVSMVVTLNPAPQYANETKHVLSLAAVAKDLQINNTALYASSLESSTQDTMSSASPSEVTRLKTELELLHFELVQAESRNKELQATMEEKQIEVAATMREIVKEAKDYTREYYEFQLTALRNEMEEMIEDYESRIAKTEHQLSEVMQARSRLEEEVKHLRTCLHERDEKTFKVPEITNPEEVVVTDSDDEGSDPLNQSLEPAFRKDMNKSAVTQDHDKPDGDKDDEYSDQDQPNDDKNNEEDSDESSDTIKQNDTTKNSDYETGDESEMKGLTDSSSTYFDNNESEVRVLTEPSSTDFNKIESEIKVSTEPSLTDFNKIKSEIKVSTKISLTDFNKIEREIILLTDSPSTNYDQIESEMKVLLQPSSTYFNNIEVTATASNKMLAEIITSARNNHDRSPSIVSDDTEPFEPSTMKKLLGENVAQLEVLSTINKHVKKHESLDVFEGLDSPQVQPKEVAPTPTKRNLENVCESTQKLVYCQKETKPEVTTIYNPVIKHDPKNVLEGLDSPQVKLNDMAPTPTKRNLENVCDGLGSKVKPKEIAPTPTKRNLENACESIQKLVHSQKETKPEVLLTVNKQVSKHEYTNLFEGLESSQVKPKEIVCTPSKSNLENVCDSIQKLVLSQKERYSNKQEIKQNTIPSAEEPENKQHLNIPELTIHVNDKSIVLNETHKQDNTIEEFENIYKDLSTQRPTEFDLLATTQDTDTNTKEDTDIFAKPESDKENKANEPIVKYNLRHKSKSVLNTSNVKKVKTEEVLLESTAKCESKKYKRSLRLRRPKNEGESSDTDEKLKDILNLKKEFSDVTLGLPAVKKEVNDIPSPEKLPDEKDLPPLMGIQSCPSKSVQRSRRKLFTPRAEPLEESPSQAGASGERLYVPRPSYHRTRARRKL